MLVQSTAAHIDHWIRRTTTRGLSIYFIPCPNRSLEESDETLARKSDAKHRVPAQEDVHHDPQESHHQASRCHTSRGITKLVAATPPAPSYSSGLSRHLFAGVLASVSWSGQLVCLFLLLAFRESPSRRQQDSVTLVPVPPHAHHKLFSSAARGTPAASQLRDKRHRTPKDRRLPAAATGGPRG